MKQSFNIFKSEINNIIKETEVYKTAFSKESAVTFSEQEDEQNNITGYECRIECKNGRVAVIRYDLTEKNDFQRWSCKCFTPSKIVSEGLAVQLTGSDCFCAQDAVLFAYMSAYAYPVELMAKYGYRLKKYINRELFSKGYCMFYGSKVDEGEAWWIDYDQQGRYHAQRYLGGKKGGEQELTTCNLFDIVLDILSCLHSSTEDYRLQYIEKLRDYTL